MCSSVPARQPPESHVPKALRAAQRTGTLGPLSKRAPAVWPPSQTFLKNRDKRMSFVKQDTCPEC